MGSAAGEASLWLTLYLFFLIGGTCFYVFFFFFLGGGGLYNLVLSVYRCLMMFVYSMLDCCGAGLYPVWFSFFCFRRAKFFSPAQLVATKGNSSVIRLLMCSCGAWCRYIALRVQVPPQKGSETPKNHPSLHLLMGGVLTILDP